jgi:hypothetical protein
MKIIKSVIKVFKISLNNINYKRTEINSVIHWYGSDYNTSFNVSEHIICELEKEYQKSRRIEKLKNILDENY